ncbi:MAG: hypothetical protein ABFC84_00900 [Veillonellales bacterium]
MDVWKKRLNGDPVPWLLSSNPWTQYASMVNLLNISPASFEAKQVKKKLLEHPLVIDKIKETEQWLTKAATRNSDPNISYFKLRMLSEFELNINDTGIEQIINKAISHKIEGMFAVRGRTPDMQQQGKEYVASDPYADIWHISPCNSPAITYSLIKLGYMSEEVTRAVNALCEKWDTPLGWFCHFFFVEGQYKKLHAGCPMAGIMALDVFSLIPELKESIFARNAFEPILFHRNYGKTIYYFGRSKKFWTMKFPFVWYNALYLADVLTRFNFLKGNDLVEDLIKWIESCQDEQGRFKATSVFMPYKEWDFSNKKVPSPWITYLCCNILKRWYDQD